MKSTLFLPVLLGTVAVPALAQRMEHNAYLRKPVFSRADLLRQFDNDPVVRRRYVKKFGMNERRIREVLATLSLKPLKKGKRYLAYNIDPKSNKVGRRMLFFPKGTLVFADAKDRPVLKRSCGNPMVAYLPTITRTAVNYGPKPQEEVTQAAVVPQTNTEPPPEPSEAVVQPPAPTEPEPAAVVPEPAPAVTPTPEPAITPTTVAPTVAPPSIIPPLILGLAATGLIIAGTTQGGDDTPVVPEPASMVVVGLGLAALKRRRKG